MKRLYLVFVLSGVFNSAYAGWEFYLGADSSSGAKEGFAFSSWTIYSPSPDWPDKKIEAALVASCNDRGEKSLYLRILPVYPISESERGVEILNGKIKWDSSNPYGVPFIYDARLNALQLRSGLEDSFSMIEDGNKVAIQIPWNDGNRNSNYDGNFDSNYGDNYAFFEFSLSGSSQALRTAFDYCLIDLKTS